LHFAAFVRASFRSSASSAAFWRTHRRMLLYLDLNASRVAFVLPRSPLHRATAARVSPLSGFVSAAAADGTRSAATRPMTTVVFYMPVQAPDRPEGSEVTLELHRFRCVPLGDAGRLHTG
jgi:hypothetical protein